MSTDLEIRNRILITSFKLFLQLGISKVTMDELANELGMSKKTLYKYFTNKEAIVRELLEWKMKESEQCCSAIMNNNDNSHVEKIKKIMTFVGEQYSQLTPQFLSDIRRNSPEIWKEIDKWRTKQIMQEFSRLVSDGMNQGVFRNDINREIIVMMYAGAVQYLINPEVLSQFSFSAADVFETIIKIMYEGIFSDDAREKYKESNSVLDGTMAL
ncbi:MAG: TetR/AcrR family transcriptional regulator [Ignavibacteriales bacterium]|nr:TetR/AcrR family transcriptional regulator [Ignavibacteriales bacterium]